MPTKRIIAIFPSTATSGTVFRVLVSTYYDPASFFSKTFSSLSPVLFATQYSGYCMNRGDRSSFFPSRSFPFDYYETQRKTKSGEANGKAEGEERWLCKRRWRTSDVCPRGIVIFIGLQLSRGFSSSYRPRVSCRRFFPSARKASGNENTLLFIRRVERTFHLQMFRSSM